MPAVQYDSRTLRVEGLRELQRAFHVAGRDLKTNLRRSLRETAEPVRADAENLAAAGIRNIGDRWSRMRVGVTRSLVYVAPRQRGVKTKARATSKRPNLAPLMIERAMDPAFDRNIDRVERGVEVMLGDIARRWERV